jgi:SAM-dependent methyltransferase
VDIHGAAQAFGGVADEYERGRPEYPPAAVSLLVRALGIGPGVTVVDLAAGTGKLTRLLVPAGARILAVEPIAEMRRVLEVTVAGVEAFGGTAEHMPFADASADVCTVAQAFHWFRGAEALAEIRRVLRPQGRLGLVWNRRDLSQPLQADIERVIDRYRGETPTLATGAWRDGFVSSALFGPLAEDHVPMAQVLDADGLVDRVLSVSFVAALAGPERRRVADEVRAIARRHGDEITLAYVTDCYWCQAR